MAELRIPFEEAINEKRLLKRHFWEFLTFPQQAVLMAMYGLPLSNDQDERGFSRLDYFWASQGYGTFDEHGYLLKVHHPGPYLPQEYRELWMIAGVRSGKSLIADTATAYEAVLGGHEEFIRKGTRGYCFQVAQDLRSAQKAINTIHAVLETMPYLTAPFLGSGNINGRMMDSPTANRISLWNGMTIMTMPPTVKAIRGYDSPCAVLDEIGVWPTDKDAANLDNDVYEQATSRQAQFENPKVFGLSSPWIMSGMLYERTRAGTNGKNVLCSDCEVLKVPNYGCPDCSNARASMSGKLVYHLPTAAFHNPLVKKSWLISKKAGNPQSFQRECMAKFMPSTEAFLDAERIDACVAKGIKERDVIVVEPGQKGHRPFYVAALDPAFKHDAFAFGIAHTNEEGKIVVDVMRQWRPVAGQPLSPAFVLDQITPLMKKYGCISAMSDQHHFESLRQLAEDRGWSIEPVTFTYQSKNDLFGNLQTLVNIKRIVLLDNPDCTHELKSLQRNLTSAGNVQIAAPTGLHDDLAIIVALLAGRAIFYSSTVIEPPKAESYYDLIESQIARRKRVEKEALW